MKILIIEDDKEVLNKMNQLLKNHKLYQATYLKEALEILRDNNYEYDLIICDHYFPKFADSRYPDESGQEVFMHCHFDDYKGYFLHHSADPCPEKYNEELKKSMNFHSIKKYCKKSLSTYINSITVKHDKTI